MKLRVLKSKITDQYNNFRFWLSATNSLFFHIIYKCFYSPKKGSISHIIDRYSLDHKMDFTVVQIGANDGMINDPIHKFIKRDRWKGVLLEPQKFVFDKYLKKVYRKDRGIKLINAAIGDNDGSTFLYKVGFSNARWAHGLASFERETLEKSIQSGYVKRKAAKESVDIPLEPDKQIVCEEVKVISPKTLVREYGLDRINLLQIDTEGYDYNIIKMFKIKETQPGLIVFENLHLSDSDYRACIKYLNDNNYKTRTIGSNTLAMLNPGKEYLSFFEV